MKTMHGYGPYTRGCRCDACRQAKADYMRERRSKARAIAAPHTKRGAGNRAWTVGATRYIASIDRHGTTYGFDERGCRCAECTQAARDWKDAKDPR